MYPLWGIENGKIAVYHSDMMQNEPCLHTHTYQMPYGNVVRVGGGCGPLYLNGPEVDCLLCQWGGCVPYWGPRGVLIQYIDMLKK